MFYAGHFRIKCRSPGPNSQDTLALRIYILTWAPSMAPSVFPFPTFLLQLLLLSQKVMMQSRGPRWDFTHWLRSLVTQGLGLLPSYQKSLAGALRKSDTENLEMPDAGQCLDKPGRWSIPVLENSARKNPTPNLQNSVCASLRSCVFLPKSFNCLWMGNNLVFCQPLPYTHLIMCQVVMSFRVIPLQSIKICVLL